jgi:hypothetical protein
LLRELRRLRQRSASADEQLRHARVAKHITNQRKTS